MRVGEGLCMWTMSYQVAAYLLVFEIYVMGIGYGRRARIAGCRIWSEPWAKARRAGNSSLRPTKGLETVFPFHQSRGPKDRKGKRGRARTR